MKYLPIADLHLDMWEESNRDPFEGIGDALADLDLVLIAGDLSNKPKRRWPRLLSHVQSLAPTARIAIFPGNHDFYQFRIDDEARLSQLASEAGADYVNGGSFTLGRTRFICATLWTDFALGGDVEINANHAASRMNDYRLIRVAKGGFRRLQPSDTIHLHRRQLKSLSDHARKPWDGETVIVTHHAPHPAVLADHADGLDAAYASDLSATLRELSPASWLFGHCHDATNQKVHGVPLESISLGYPWEVEAPAARVASLIRHTAS